MRDPIIIEGPPFDWKRGGEMASRVQNDDGSTNWWAAMGADPGCMTCSACGLSLWKEGYRVKCPDCGHEFDTPLRPATPEREEPE
jgi:uncharacterized Zn finger protein (UPF0148 family)